MQLKIKELRLLIKNCITESLSDQQSFHEYERGQAEEDPEYDERQEKLNDLVRGLIATGISLEELEKTISLIRGMNDKDGDNGFDIMSPEDIVTVNTLRTRY